MKIHRGFLFHKHLLLYKLPLAQASSNLEIKSDKQSDKKFLQNLVYMC